IASSAPEVLVPQARRLRLVVLVHMPFGHRPPDDGVRARERAVLSAAGEVVTTSAWAGRRLIELYELPADRVHIAHPGVETVVTEALAHGLPVIAAEVGGVTEALGQGADGIRPGLLVAPEDPVALGSALRAWLGDEELRARLRRAARERRQSLSRWSATASTV